MIEDFNQLGGAAALEADVCIVGGGAAGISLALALGEQGVQVLLLESGGLQAEAATQALYQGSVANPDLHSPADTYRQRRWGGSTTLWGGRCVPFDDIDFEARPYLPHTAWPLPHAELAAHYAQATQLLEAGEPHYDATHPANAFMPPMFAGFESPQLSTDTLERFSCPTDLGQRYARRLALAPTVRVLTYANVTHLQLDRASQEVQSLTVQSLQGRRATARARVVVLATGGLEVPRLLLASNDVQPAGIGNHADLVGRRYMCHIAGNVGELTVTLPRAQVHHGYARSPLGAYARRRLQVRPSIQREMSLPNMVARLHFPKITDPSHRSGVLSGLCLARRFISYEYGKRLNDGEAHGATHLLRHLRNVLADPLDTTAFLAHWLRHRTLAERKFPSVILRNTSNRFSLEVHAEQIPRLDSRVSLGEGVDALGQRQLHIDWRYSPADIDGVARSLNVMGQALQQGGVGAFQFDPETLERDLTRYGAYGGHHIGTACMGADPAHSVVNADTQVHGVHNLFIASSAVFPSSSQANPTLLIVALALRLAQHIGQRGRAEGWT